jgi:hypothetical protein
MSFCHQNVYKFKTFILSHTDCYKCYLNNSAKFTFYEFQAILLVSFHDFDVDISQHPQNLKTMCSRVLLGTGYVSFPQENTDYLVFETWESRVI